MPQRADVGRIAPVRIAPIVRKAYKNRTENMPTALAARRSKSGKMSDGTARGAPLRGTSTAKETVPKISWTSRMGKIGMRRNRSALKELLISQQTDAPRVHTMHSVT